MQGNGNGEKQLKCGSKENDAFKICISNGALFYCPLNNGIHKAQDDVSGSLAGKILDVDR